MKCYIVTKNEWTSDYTVMPSGIFDFFEDNTLINFTSSYNVIAARLLGLSYPDYLRYCQSIGARIKGKYSYSYPVWTDKAAADKLCNKLNEEWNKVVNECFKGVK